MNKKSDFNFTFEEDIFIIFNFSWESALWFVSLIDHILANDNVDIPNRNLISLNLDTIR